MSKKTGRFIFWGLVAGAAAAGVYHYLQNKDKEAECYDDFDDFDNFEDIKEDTVSKERSYVPLDFENAKANAKAFMNDTFQKAKDAVSKVSRKMQNEEDDIIDDMDAVEVVQGEFEPEDKEARTLDASDSSEVISEAVPELEVADAEIIEQEATTENFFDDDEE